MGPLRILILAVLIYIGYLLIRANFIKSSDSEEKKDEPTHSGEAITDVLVEDPVCHKLVPKEQAYRLEADDGAHYFCSKECGDKFNADREEKG